MLLNKKFNYSIWHSIFAVVVVVVVVAVVAIAVAVAIVVGVVVLNIAAVFFFHNCTLCILVFTIFVWFLQLLIILKFT